MMLQSLKKISNATNLKILAILLMFLDHIYEMFGAFGAFFLAGISICAWDLMVEGVKEKRVRSFWKGLGLFLLPILLALPALFLSGYLASENISPLMVQIIAFFIMAIPNILVVEGGDVMVYLGLLFYLFRRHRIA